MHLYGHRIGQVHICPGRCHGDKPLHIPLEIVGTKYDGIHSFSQRVVDSEISPPQDAQPIL